MCRTTAEGGRRCDCSPSGVSARRARQRAAYAVKTAPWGLEDDFMFTPPPPGADPVPLPPLDDPEPPAAPAPVSPPVDEQPAPAATPEPDPEPDPEPSAAPSVHDEPAPAADPPAFGTREGIAAAIVTTQNHLKGITLTNGEAATPALISAPGEFLRATPAGLAAEAAVRDLGAQVAARADDLARERHAAIDREWVEQHDGMTEDEWVSHIIERSLVLDREYQAARQRMVSLMDANAPKEQQDAAYMQHEACEAKKLALQKELAEHAAGQDRFNARRAEVDADAVKAVLSEHRPFGGTEADLGVDPRSVKTAARKLVKAAQFYPSEWITASRDYIDPDSGLPRPLNVRSERTRAYYAHEVTVSRRDVWGSRSVEHVSYIGIGNSKEGPHAPGVNDAIHEFGHRCQQTIGGLAEIEGVFLARRTSNPETGERDPLMRYLPGVTIRPDVNAPVSPRGLARGRKEWVRPDGFVSPYVGREYGLRDAHEVFTTGMEGVWSGQYGGLVGRGKYTADHEQRHLVLGLLAAGKPSY